MVTSLHNRTLSNKNKHARFIFIAMANLQKNTTDGKSYGVNKLFKNSNAVIARVC